MPAIYILHEECPERLTLYKLDKPTLEDRSNLQTLAGLLINCDEIPDELEDWLYPADKEHRFRFGDLPVLDWKDVPVLNGPLYKVGMVL